MGDREPSLIAFLDLSEASAAPSQHAGLSETEAGAIRALASWRGSGGLRAVVVDAGPTVLGRTATIEALSSRARAWGIDGIPIVQDHTTAGLARRYGVTRTPCVFLVDAAGIVRARWDRAVDATEIASRLASFAAVPAVGPGASVR